MASSKNIYKSDDHQKEQDRHMKRKRYHEDSFHSSSNSFSKREINDQNTTTSSWKDKEEDERKRMNSLENISIPDWVTDPSLRGSSKTLKKKDKKKEYKKKKDKKKKKSNKKEEKDDDLDDKSVEMCPQIEEKHKTHLQSPRKNDDDDDVTFKTKSKNPPTTMEWGKKKDIEELEKKEKEAAKEIEPNFQLTGALAEDVEKGNIVNGIVLKWSEPLDARIPKKKWRVYVYKGDKNLNTLHIHRQSSYLFGREKKVADILIEHESCSKQHAVLQYRLFEKESEDGLSVQRDIRPYLMDLQSTHGTLLNGKKMTSSRYVELKHMDVLNFGHSSRDYVVMLTE